MTEQIMDKFDVVLDSLAVLRDIVLIGLVLYFVIWMEKRVKK